MKIPKKFIYVDGDGKKCYDYCESCEKPIKQIMVKGQGVCEYCKSPNQIMIYEVKRMVVCPLCVMNKEPTNCKMTINQAKYIFKKFNLKFNNDDRQKTWLKKWVKQ